MQLSAFRTSSIDCGTSRNYNLQLPEQRDSTNLWAVQLRDQRSSFRNGLHQYIYHKSCRDLPGRGPESIS